MKEKQFDPARINDESPAPGMGAVNTHNPDERESKESNESKGSHESNGSNESRESHPIDETHGAELNIKSESPSDRDHSKSVEADVTPRNLEADSDGA